MLGNHRKLLKMAKTHKTLVSLIESALDDVLCNISAIEPDQTTLLCYELNNDKNTDNFKTIMVTFIVARLVSAGMDIKQATKYAIDASHALEETENELIAGSGLNKPPKILHS